jgi:hypothetical protein
MAGDTPVLDSNYFMEHPEEYDKLTDAEQNELLVNGSVSRGDTEAAKPAADDDSGAPAADADAKNDDDKGKGAVETEAKVDDKDTKADQQQANPDDDKPGIQSKDGKHVIPYSELEKARTEAEAFKSQLADKDKLIADLTAAKAKDDQDGGTKAQDELLAGLREDFPELADKILPVVQSLVEKGVKDATAVIEQRLQPLQKSAEDLAIDKHFDAIRGAHSDYDALMASKKVDEWVNAQPSIVKSAYTQVLEKGTAEQVIELIGIYKDANKPADTPQPTKEELEAKAKAEIDAATKKTGAPASLTDIPASSAAVVDEATAINEMDPLALMRKFEGKTPAQIEEIVNRVI